MEGDIDAELLQICWTPLGFKLSERHCAAKFYAKAGQLHTMLTDYERIYHETADFMKKFSSLNTKLGGPEKTLLEKVREMFVLPTTKVSNERKNDNTLEFHLEVAGKRVLKWRFCGQDLGSMACVFSHITRPLLNILSIVVDECDLSSVRAPISGDSFSGLFGKSFVKKLYETIAIEPVVARHIGSAYRDNKSGEPRTTDIDGANHTDKSDADSLSKTLPPSLVYEAMSGTNRDNELGKTRSTNKLSPKKPRLRF